MRKWGKHDDKVKSFRRSKYFNRLYTVCYMES